MDGNTFIAELKKVAIRVHDFLTGFFAGIGLRLVDIKLEVERINKRVKKLEDLREK